MLRFAIRNIFRNRLRAALTLSAIIFGVAAIVLSGGFVEDVFVQLREATIHSQLGHLQVYKKGYRDHGRQKPFKYMIDAAGDMVGQFEHLPHVEDVMVRINFSGLINNGNADHQIIGEGVEPGKEARLGSSITLTAGRQLNAEDEYGILVGEGVASSLKLGPGDFVTLLVNTPEVGLNSLDFTIVGIFRTFSKEYDARAVRIPLAAAQELVYTDKAHSLVFSLDDHLATSAVVERVRENLPGEEYEVYPWYELADFYRKTVDLYKRQFGVLQLIILFMVLLSVVNSINMAIYERTGEYGTLMALGKRRSEVFWLILLENTLLGLLGAALGVALGVLLAMVITRIGIPMPPPPNSNAGYIATIRVVPEAVISGFLTGLVATVLAAIMPARRVSRIQVVDALRENI